MFWKTQWKWFNLPSMWQPAYWSITFRLASVYMISVFSILVLATFSIYWIFSNHLKQADTDLLTRNSIVIQEILQNQPHNMSALREEILFEAPIDHYFARVLDASGHIILETPGMQIHTPPTLFSSVMVARDKGVQVTYTQPQGKKKRHYMLLSRVVGSTAWNDTTYRVQMSQDVTAENALLKAYRRGLWFVLCIGILCAAIVSVVVTRKAMKPLQAITSSTERITVEHLKERLDPTSWPREFSHLAHAFNNMLDRVESGFSRLSQFSSELAHEIRTPIANLMGEAEVVLSRTRTPAEYQQTLESSLEECGRLSHVIDTLLFLARSENPQAVLNKRHIELAPILEGMCDFYEAMAEEQGVTLKSEGVGFVVADESMLRRALSNVVSNALHYTEAGGCIMLASVMIDGRQAIRVTDTGAGIPAEHIPYLMKRFYRVDPQYARHKMGSGLGLAIVKSIMDLHLGEIRIDSVVGRGTAVTLIF